MVSVINFTERIYLKMINLDSLIEKIHGVVKSHYLGDGAYARYLWQDKKGTRKMGINEYGCADAMNILYIINKFPKGEEREQALAALQGLQNPETGLFEEHTHHFIHTTAHCTAAIELFDETPKYPQVTMQQYFTKEGIKGLLDSLDWANEPWPMSHRGAGAYVVGVLTDNVDLEWQEYYFSLIYDNTDEKWGMSRAGTIDGGTAPAFHHLNGWFHYMFNMQYAKKPLKYPETMIDSLIALYDNNELGDTFGKNIGFNEIDWVFALNRATRQTPHRFYEAKDRLRDFAKKFIDYMESLDYSTHDRANDLHMLFGALCALAELQTALPGEILSTKPLRLVLDRRPFI